MIDVNCINGFEENVLFGHTFKTRKDNNAGIYNEKFINSDMSIDGIVVNHNAYIDGPTQYCRNFEVTFYQKKVGDTSFVKKEDCELNVTILLESLNQFKPHDHNHNFSFEEFARNALLGNFDSDHVTVHELLCMSAEYGDVYSKYLDMWYTGCLPKEWQGLLRLGERIYYITLDNIRSGYFC